jgi:hypothetical protein
MTMMMNWLYKTTARKDDLSDKTTSCCLIRQGPPYIMIRKKMYTKIWTLNPVIGGLETWIREEEQIVFGSGEYVDDDGWYVIF